MLSRNELQEAERMVLEYGHLEAARRMGIHPKNLSTRLYRLKAMQPAPAASRPIVNFAHVQNTPPETCAALIDGILSGRIDYTAIPNKEEEIG